MKNTDIGIGVTLTLGEVALTFEVKKGDPKDPPLKIEANHPGKYLTDKQVQHEK